MRDPRHDSDGLRTAHKGIARWRRVALLALAVLCTFACARAPLSASERQTRSELSVARGRLTSRVLLTGELRAARAEILVVPRIPSWQTTLRWIAPDGTEVQSGDPVAELDNTEVASTLAEKRAAAARHRDELQRLVARTAAAEAEKEFALLAATTTLDKAKIAADLPPEIVSRRDFEQRRLALARAGLEQEKASADLEALRRGNAADLEVQRLTLEKAEREIAVAERAIDELALRAPRAGVLIVGEEFRSGRKLQTGDNVWVGMPIASIPDLASLEVEAALSDVNDGEVQTGQRGLCRLDAFAELTIPCRVTEVTPVAQEAGRETLRRNFRVRLALERVEQGRMLPGMSIKVEMPVELAADALLAPRAALRLAPEPPLARRASGETVPVKIGPCSAQACVVAGGLIEGDRLASFRQNSEP